MYRASAMDQTGGDSLWVAQTSWSILADHDLALDEFAPAMGESPVQPPPHLVVVDGERYNRFPWGASLVAAPFVALEAARTWVTGGDFGAEIERAFPARSIERDTAAMIGGVTVGVMFAMLWRRTRSYLWATLGAVVFAFGTGVYSTTTRALWIQGPALLVTTLALWLAYELSVRDGAETRVDAAAGAGLGVLAVLGYAARPTLSLLAVVLLVVVLRRGRASAIGFVVATALALAAFGAVNQTAFGRLLPPYFSSDRLGFGASTFEAMAANLVSPARGLVVWAPVVLVGLGAYALHITRAPLIDHLVVGWVAVHLVAVSAIDHWWAGASVGPRFMLDVVPGLFLLAAAAPAVLRGASSGLRRAALVAGLVLSAWSIGVNGRAATNQSVQSWNFPDAAHRGSDQDPGRVWDWGDPQFLR